jgi:phosphoribosylanthranilate isomerase
MTGLVKICGMMRSEDAEAAADAGADLIGFVFAESRRRVEPAAARIWIDRARSVNPRIQTVGLFVHATPETIREVVAISGVDLVQLHGMPEVDEIERIGIPCLIVVRQHPEQTGADVLEYAATVARNPLVQKVMLDAYHPTMAGGTGTIADWTLAAELSRALPLMLAGGLDPENVADAIGAVRPAGVDVSSGVERMGAKDPELIRAFVANARSGFESAGYSISSGTSSQDAP